MHRSTKSSLMNECVVRNQLLAYGRRDENPMGYYRTFGNNESNFQGSPTHHIGRSLYDIIRKPVVEIEWCRYFAHVHDPNTRSLLINSEKHPARAKVAMAAWTPIFLFPPRDNAHESCTIGTARKNQANALNMFALWNSGAMELRWAHSSTK